MGKLILCNGKRTKRPYFFGSFNIRTYSIEELCYYLYNNIYYIDENIFNQGLINWIDFELDLKDRAEKLREMKANGADFSSMIVAVLCSSNYYDEREIEKLVRLLNNIGKMSVIEKRCYRANNHLEKGNYERALKDYDKIIKSHEASSLPGQELGKIMHNLAVAKSYIKGIKSGVEYFSKAYELSLNKESLMQYLYGLLIMGDIEKFDSAINKYKINEEIRKSIEKSFYEESKKSKEYHVMNKVTNLRNALESKNETEYKIKTKEIIDSWVDEYEKGGSYGY